MTMPTMPFGKHRNTPIDQIDPKYLRWCLKEIKTLAPELKRDIQSVLAGKPLSKSDYEQIDEMFSKYWET
jgi:hypothetical protein